MKLKWYQLSILLLVFSILLVACSSINPEQTPAGESTEIPIVISDIEIVSEGRIVPNETAQLSFFTNGQVEVVYVEEGDSVKKGDIVASLGNREEIEAGIAAAEAELLSAQQALQDLYDNAEILRANALRNIAEAEKVLRDAQYTVDNFTVPQDQIKYTATEGIIVTRKKLDEARVAFEPYKYYPSGDSTREDLKEDLDDAQSNLNTAVKRLEYETNLENAEANLQNAKNEYEKVKEGPNQDDIDALQARITAAEASVESAKAALDHLDLESTIDGIVVKQDLIIGQLVQAGQPMMIIADYSKIYAETDDLTEIEVVDISNGQDVTVVADALPDVEMTGIVEKIDNIFEEKRGDITYTARILLNNVDPRIKWGMTVVITFHE
jgi:multidrug resistance efflux pump